jgi:hypothetical protein
MMIDLSPECVWAFVGLIGLLASISGIEQILYQRNRTK